MVPCCAGSRKTTEGDDVSVLRVDRCDVTDVGVYTCEAVNRLGRAADSVTFTGLRASRLCHVDDSLIFIIIK